MALRYYVIVITGRNNRWFDIQNSLIKQPGLRELPSQLLHWRVSVDGTMVLAEVNATEEEHTAMLAMWGVTYIGGRNPDGTTEQSVYDYLDANRTLWEKPMGS